jgi:hypothetical protein
MVIGTLRQELRDGARGVAAERAGIVIMKRFAVVGASIEKHLHTLPRPRPPVTSR